MASAETPSHFDRLPDEIIIHVINYFEPHHIAVLQLVSKQLRKICLDSELWKSRCFERSSWYRSSKTRCAALFDSRPDQSPGHATGQITCRGSDEEECDRRTARDMANWDPSFPGERVFWYEEYTQRHARACMNWLESPRMRCDGVGSPAEARGLALYSPYDGNDSSGTMMAVSPLDDGSVCLWDVRGARGKQGRIAALSKSGILFNDTPGEKHRRRPASLDGGVTECVSVHNGSHRAFFAIQQNLIEVDLHHLEVISRQSFGSFITTLSTIQDGVPLTVGTSDGLQLHDFRFKANSHCNAPERSGHLSSSRPLSILHLPLPGTHDVVSDDIFVSGRFKNILHYDRRKFDETVGSIWSGASIKSLAATPYTMNAIDTGIRCQAAVAPERAIQKDVQTGGTTLIAGGEYNSKGSLELYSVDPATKAVGGSIIPTHTTQNRRTAAASTILSVTTHGTKIVCSDGMGYLKWFERDGFTECRRVKLGEDDAQEPLPLFDPTLASGDIARKIVSTRCNNQNSRSNDDNILFWTGEKLGMVSFTTSPLFSKEAIEAENPGSAVEEQARSTFVREMRLALREQANEVAYLGGLTW